MGVASCIRNIIVNTKLWIGYTNKRLCEVSQRKYSKFVQHFGIKKEYRKMLYDRYQISEDEKQAVDEFYLKNYGEKVPYEWHRMYASFTGMFDPQYIPCDIYWAEIEHFMNPYKEYNVALENKDIILKLAKTIGIRVPETYLVCSEGMFINTVYEFVSQEQAVGLLKKLDEFFVKATVGSCGGEGCILYRKSDWPAQEVEDKIREILHFGGENFIVQEVIENHETIKRIYPMSLNTFRIGTYQWKGKIYHMPFVLRLGRGGSVVDNASAGGIYIGVEDDGRLYEKAFSDEGEELSEHPDTGIIFKDYQLQSPEVVIEAAKRLHRALPMLGVVNWDFVLNDEGVPVLIEANICSTGVDMQQNACGKGLFGEQTAEILKWTKLMKNTPLRERNKFYFGKGMK